MTDEPFFRRYTQLVPETDLVGALRSQFEEVITPWLTLDDERCQVLHRPYTWSIREVIGHMVDTEIVFSYRALRFSRNDPTPLPGFEEGNYVSAGEYATKPVQVLVEHLSAVRLASICLFEQMPADAWSRVGQASTLTWSVIDLCQAIIGHVRHHAMIIERRLA